MTILHLELSKAVKSHEEALSLLQESGLQNIEVQKGLREGFLQRFEYSMELCWKASMKILGSTTQAAKPAVREMARNNLIANPELWLSFVDSRTETSHAYDEDIAIKIFANVQKFLTEANLLIQNLGNV